MKTFQQFTEAYNNPYLFHGTTLENAEKIKLEGLKVQDTGGSISAGNTREMALNYAAGRTFQQKGIVPDQDIALIVIFSRNGFVETRHGEFYSMQDVPPSKISVEIYRFGDVVDNIVKGKVKLKNPLPKAR